MIIREKTLLIKLLCLAQSLTCIKSLKPVVTFRQMILSIFIRLRPFDSNKSIGSLNIASAQN